MGRSLADVLDSPGGGENGDQGGHSPLDGENLELRLPGGDADSRTYEVRREPLQDARGRPAGELVMLRDVTERIEAEEALAHLLDERSRVAAALERSLVPGELPQIPGTETAGRYEPAGDGHEIGGDFFDIFPLDGHVWGVVLGDVSGKGAEAAAVTALTRYTLRALADPRHPPSRTLRDLNARLLSATDGERHCTLVYALVRPGESGLEITLSLAGHHPPLVTRSSGEVEPVGELGTALGLLDSADLYDARVVLGAGESVCLFTDGLVEARRGTELFGEHRVTDILRSLQGAAAAAAGRRAGRGTPHLPRTEAGRRPRRAPAPGGCRAMSARKKPPSQPVIARNRKAAHDYHLLESWEAGIVLQGSEVKALRAGRASLVDGFADVDGGEIWLHGVHIPQYAQATWTNHASRRKRKLLLHRAEIDKIERRVNESGLTIVPLSLYFKDGRAKVEIALAKGKKTWDKRQALAERQAAREAEQVVSRRLKGMPD